jgi:hypothetical protein
MMQQTGNAGHNRQWAMAVVLVLGALLSSQTPPTTDAYTSHNAAVATAATSTANNAAPFVPANSTGHSLNWAGYVAQGHTYTGVSATWVVPTVVNSGDLAADATWVGIGGVVSHDLIQAGTQAIETPDGDIQYQAWIETLPDYSTPAPIAVHPGDTVAVSLVQQSTGTWLITITNSTTGKTYSTTRNYSSTLSSAEWIEEMPSGDVFLPLSQFGRVMFSNVQTIQDGASVSASAAQAEPLSMVNMLGEELATPSVLGAGGASFSVARSDASAVAVIMHVVHRRYRRV